jgi:large repetitive protein
MALSLSSSGVGQTSATLNWSVSGIVATNYAWDVYISGSGGTITTSGFGPYSVASGSGSTTVTGLSPGTSYTFNIDLTLQNGNVGGGSAQTSFTTAAQTYSVSYNAAGGSPTPSGGSYTAGTSLTVGSAPSLSGYNFNYWSASGGLSGAYVPGTGFTMPAAAVTFTASYTAVNNPPSWSDNVLGAFVVGAAYSDGVSATFSPTYSVSAGSLPAGISLNTSTGAITGTPTGATYSYSFTITATNSYGSVSASFSGNVQGMFSVYDGAAWNKKVMYVRNSGNTAWVAAPVYVYNGTSWIASS